MTSPLIEALALILSPLSVTALMFFLGRSAVNQFLARNLESHKAKLSAISEREVELLKAELTRTAKEHDIIFERLHAERAQIIKELYQKTRALSKAAKRYAAREEVINAEDHERNRESVEATATNLTQAMLDARIFLPEELCAKIQRLMHDVVGFATNIAGEFLVFGETSPQQQLATVLTNKEKLEEAAWKLESELATEFRKIFGVAGPERGTN